MWPVIRILRTIHGGISQCCKLIKHPAGLVLLLLHFVLDILQLVPNSLQQESCKWENLTTQLPPMPWIYGRFDFLTYLGSPAGTFWECEWWHFARCWAHSQQQLSLQPQCQTQFCWHTAAQLCRISRWSAVALSIARSKNTRCLSTHIHWYLTVHLAVAVAAVAVAAELWHCRVAGSPEPV